MSEPIFDTSFSNRLKQWLLLGRRALPPTRYSSADIQAEMAPIDAILAAGLTEMHLSPGTVVRNWAPASETLQSVIDSITDMSSSKPYTIMIPPGRYTLGTLAVKPWVNLRGYGGRGRMTVFAAGAINLLDASIPAGVHRWRMDGIRLETVPLTIVCTTAGKTILPVLDDCPCNSASPIVTQGRTYGAATTMVNLELRNMNIDCNTTAQKFELTRLSVWGCSLLGLYFLNSDAYFFGSDISSGCNVVNDAASGGGWFEFNGCKIDTMVLNDPTSESTLATLCASDNENVQIFGTFHGATAPGSINFWGRMQPGMLYYCHSDSKLYVKTGVVGTNTWVVVGTQA